LITKSLKKGKW